MGEPDTDIGFGFPGNVTAQIVLDELNQVIPMAKSAVFYPFGQVVLKNPNPAFIGLPINLSPKAVYPDP
jgi:hypothetical protein